MGILIGEVDEILNESADDGTELDTEIRVQLDKNCLPIKSIITATTDEGVVILVIQPDWNGEKVHFNE